MARFRRGVNNAKVYPVGEGYTPLAQNDPEQVNPPPEFTQQTGVTSDPAKK